MLLLLLKEGSEAQIDETTGLSWTYSVVGDVAGWQ